jgi:2-desacetyl-2-hydroxyethyl bacteriochlorophyllide A dehydrogenase
MDAFVCTRPGHIEYRDIALPGLHSGQAVIKIRRIGICGTDIHALQGNQPYFQYPRILGHELAADFVEADGASDFVPGEPLTIIPYFNCGHCQPCLSGRPNCCISLKVSGVHQDGGMAEFFSVPIHALLHAEGLSYDELALVEPLAIGAHGIRRSEIREGEFILIMGAGPIGIACIEFAVMAGARVIVLELQPERLNFCRQFEGLEMVFDGREGHLLEKIAELTRGNMPEVVLDATGNLQAIKNGFEFMAHGGKYVLVGLQKDNISFSHPEFHKREATLMSSRNATKQDFLRVMEAIRNKKIQPLRMINHICEFKNIARDFRDWLDPQKGIIKAMVYVD